METKTIGSVISPLLVEIEDKIWHFESEYGVKPEYTKDAFRATIKIFMSAMMDKMWELQEEENISQNIRESMEENCGNELRTLVKTYTGIDTYDYYV